MRSNRSLRTGTLQAPKLPSPGGYGLAKCSCCILTRWNDMHVERTTRWNDMHDMHVRVTGKQGSIAKQSTQDPQQLQVPSSGWATCSRPVVPHACLRLCHMLTASKLHLITWQRQCCVSGMETQCAVEVLTSAAVAMWQPHGAWSIMRKEVRQGPGQHNHVTCPQSLQCGNRSACPDQGDTTRTTPRRMHQR